MKDTHQNFCIDPADYHKIESESHNQFRGVSKRNITDEEIEKWANEHNVTHSLGDADLLQEMFRKGCIRGAIQMRDGKIK